MGGGMPIDVRDQAFFRLLQLASPTLPVGGFSWSQGLEAAVDTGWVGDVVTAEAWISGLLTHSLGRLDLPVLLRLHSAWSLKDHKRVGDWNDFLYASRTSRESRAEDREMGRALARLLMNLGLNKEEILSLEAPTYVALFALAGVTWHLDDVTTAGALAWSFVENQVAAAVKLVPLGQSAGQAIMMRLCETLPHVIEAASSLPDGALGAWAPAVSLLSAMHENQHTRLFRS